MAGDVVLIITDTDWGFSLLLGGVPAVCVAFIAPKWVRDQGKLQLLGDSRSGVIQALAPEMTGLRVVPPGGTLNPCRLGPSCGLTWFRGEPSCGRKKK